MSLESWIPAGAAVAAACATIWYAWVATRQLSALRRQGATLERQVTHQIRLERPWLVVKAEGQPEYRLHPDENEPRSVYLRAPWSITNVGKSPAWLYRQTVRVVPVPDSPVPDVPPELGDEDAPFGRLAIPPGAGHSAPRITTWTPEQWKNLMPGITCLMVYGIIRYVDAEDTDHATRFCFVWHHTVPGAAWFYDPVACPAWIQYT